MRIESTKHGLSDRKYQNKGHVSSQRKAVFLCSLQKLITLGDGHINCDSGTQIIPTKAQFKPNV